MKHECLNKQDSWRRNEAFFRSLVQNSFEIIMLIDAEGAVLYANPAVKRVLGYEPESLVGTNVLSLVHPDRLTKVAEKLKLIVELGQLDEQLISRVRHADDSWRDLDIRGLGLFDDAEPGNAIINARDVTNQRLAEEELQRNADRFRAMIQNSSDIVSLSNADGALIYVSPSVERILGWPAESMIGKQRLDFMHPDDWAEASDVFQRVVESPDQTFHLEFRARATDGTWRYMESHYTNLIDDLRVGGIVTNTRDVTDRKMLEAQLSWQAFHDSLTKLPNRVLFLDRLEQALIRSRRRNQIVVVMFLDLDHFKVVNDSFGHSVGDDALVAIAERLHSSLRAEDTIARIGGDEFTILLEEVSTFDEVTDIAGRILTNLREPMDLPGNHQALVTTSIGIAICSHRDQMSPSDLIRRADVALYRAKDMGRSRWEIFDDDMRERDHFTNNAPSPHIATS